MKQLLRVALCSALFGWSTASLGYSGIVNGTLKTIIVFDNTYAFFTLSMALNTATGTPPCNVSQQFAINLSQPGGKAMVNQLLHAQSMGYSIWGIGTGACDVIADRETINYIQVNYP